jgi:hypothetical protein
MLSGRIVFCIQLFSQTYTFFCARVWHCPLQRQLSSQLSASSEWFWLIVGCHFLLTQWNNCLCFFSQAKWLTGIRPWPPPRGMGKSDWNKIKWLTGRSQSGSDPPRVSFKYGMVTTAWRKTDRVLAQWCRPLCRRRTWRSWASKTDSWTRIWSEDFGVQCGKPRASHCQSLTCCHDTKCGSDGCSISDPSKLLWDHTIFQCMPYIHPGGGGRFVYKAKGGVVPLPEKLITSPKYLCLHMKNTLIMWGVGEWLAVSTKAVFVSIHFISHCSFKKWPPPTGN